MARIPANGVCLNVEDGGEGPPLLLLHGFTGSASTWDRHVGALRLRHTTLALDLLGHGDSDAPAEPERYRMERTVEDVVVVLDALGHERVAVLGYSMGGRLALRLAADLPGRVSALILEGASPGIASAEERRERRRSDEALAEFIEREGVPAFVEHWERNPLFATLERLPEETRTALHNQRLGNSAMGLANTLRGTGAGAQMPLWDRLEEIATPALLVAGELDVKFTRIAMEMAERMPDARVEIVAGAGHAIHLERPEEFDRLVLEFLERHP